MTGRVLFHVQHLLGVGHLRRSEILADAMAAAGLDVTVALGGQPIPEVPFRRVRTAQLPPAQIANVDFSTLLDDRGRPVDERWKAERREALLALYRSTDPDVVLIELYPFGRRQFAFELIPLLETARAENAGPRIACSVRDVLVGRKKPDRAHEAADIARRLFDLVLVHGDPALIPFESTFPRAGSIADMIRYTGYVAAPQFQTASNEGAGEVIVSAGGGAVGESLLSVAMEARTFTPLADRTWRFIAGPNLSERAFQRLAASAGPCTVVERFRADFTARLATAALSISQAGYNTTMDILRSEVRAVVVPYETPSETEQRLRANLLAENGLLTVLPAKDLTPERLAKAVAAALTLARPIQRFDLGGAGETARIIKDLSKRGSAAALPAG